VRKTTVGIIGGTNGMGKWLADLLVKEDCNVYVTGRKTEMSAVDASRLCDVIVVSVPIAVTAAVIAQVGPLLKQEQLLMDLTSLKKEPVQLMLAQSISEVVGCHPLFGPTIPEAAGNNIVLCPGRGERWYAWIKKIFEKSGYTLLERTPEVHDRMMSVVQALNHLNTVTLGMAIASTGIPMSEIRQFSTPIFRSKMDIVKKVLVESPDMYADIIAGNPDVDKILQTYEQVVAEIRDLVSARDTSRLKETIVSAAKKIF
jgi:prephenate dehydrogenase